MPATNRLNPQRMYRLPWSLNDNVLSWLEPTKRCNLYCEGCYSRNVKGSDKSLEEVRADLRVFTKNRRTDSISIAGGDPLVHPQIADIVRMVRTEFGQKAIINTNGLALTESLLDSLLRAGVSGFTFHVDSGQRRPGWKDKDELELCELRLRLARMVASRKANVSVAFNCTVYPSTKQFIPALVRWAQEHIDIVNSMVFILFRTTREDQFDYYAGSKRVQLDELVYLDAERNPEPVKAPEAVDLIAKGDPKFVPGAYLGGTADPQSVKWLLAMRYGTKQKIHGYMGPRAMELVQVGHHSLRGRYLGYATPRELRLGRLAAAGFSPFDPESRRAALSIARGAIKLGLPETVHLQSILVIQPIDELADGRANMCDGCPDMTVHEGKLVWSCRLDECKQYGTFLRAVPKERAHGPSLPLLSARSASDQHLALEEAAARVRAELVHSA